MNSINSKINYELSLIHQYYKYLHHLIHSSHGINWIMEGILEDFSYDELIEGLWGKSILKNQLYNDLRSSLIRIVKLYNGFEFSNEYSINESEFYKSEDLTNLKLDLVKIMPRISEQAKEYNFDVTKGIYLDGTTFEDHLKNDREKPNMRSIGSLIDTLIKATKKNI